MANGTTNGNGSTGALKWWADHVVGPLLVLLVLGVTAWAIGANSTLQVHEQRIDSHDRQADRMEAKIDKILEEVRAR
jgi:hypothetical protein